MKYLNSFIFYILFYVILLIPIFSYSKSKDKDKDKDKNEKSRKGIGVKCTEEKDGPETCSKSVLNELKSYLSKNAEIKKTKMSFYNDMFSEKTTKSGNCFDQNDPTVAHFEFPMGTVVLLELKGVKRVAIVTDNGNPKILNKERAIDSSESMFKDLLGGSTNGLIDLNYANIGNAKVNKGGNSYENYIGCIKIINAEFRELQPTNKVTNSKKTKKFSTSR